MSSLVINSNGISGIIYPIKEHNINLLNKRDKPAYVKYITHSNSKNPTQLQKDHYLLLYLSGKSKNIVGYSKIKGIMFMKPDEIKKKYLYQIQMDEKEFSNYTSNRLSKYLIYLELYKLIFLKSPFRIEYPITMAGRYVSLNEIKRVLGEDFSD